MLVLYQLFFLSWISSGLAALKAWVICSAINLESATLSSDIKLLVKFDLEEEAEEDFCRLALVFLRIGGSVAVESCVFCSGSVLISWVLDKVSFFAEVISLS